MFISEFRMEETDASELLSLHSRFMDSTLIELSEAVNNSLPLLAVQKLLTPTTSSVPLVVCTHLQGEIGLANMLALYSAQECGYANSYDEMISQPELLPKFVKNGTQLTDWFIEHIDQYYDEEVTRRVTSWGEENDSFDPSHRPIVPILEFASYSLEQSYLRLVCAVADLDDNGGAHDGVGHVGAVTDDAIKPAGVQFLHLNTNGSISSYFAPFDKLVSDAHRWVMF